MLSSNVRHAITCSVIGCAVALLSAVLLPHHVTREAAPADPSYESRSAKACTPPQVIDYDYPATHSCVQLTSSTPTSLRFLLTLPSARHTHVAQSHIAHLVARTDGSIHAVTELKNTNHSNMLLYDVQNLTPATDYTLNVFAIFDQHPTRLQLCTGHICTRSSSRNFVLNPSFERRGDPPFFASTRSSGDRSNAHFWTPFYDGGARRMCGVLAIPGSVIVQPRSGNCVLVLGRLPGDWHSVPTKRHYGAHHAFFVNVASVFVVSAWYIRTSTSFKSKVPPSPSSSAVTASLVVSWILADGTVSDGVSVTLPPVRQWTPVCIVVEGLAVEMIHIYAHLEVDEMASGLNTDDEADVVLLDDVGAWIHTNDESFDIRACHKIPSQETNAARPQRSPPQLHLRATQRSPIGALTLAVPLTADRLLRLETLSRQYGGGGIVAAVAVRNEVEARTFALAWAGKEWLRSHVDVAFVRRGETHDLLAINALRNIAVSLARTEFVAMLDVDMTPAPDPFACMRDPNGTFLRQLLPAGHKRLLALTVFFTDVHQRAARDKEELENGLRQHVASAYCVNSQRANRLRQWHKIDVARRTRFLADYEPYVITRRDDYPEYDERFSGYGFNKIAWLLVAEAAGWEIIVLNDAFVTHLNHMESDWVSGIDESQYLQTWRRFLALTAEVGDFGLNGASAVGLIDNK